MMVAKEEVELVPPMNTPNVYLYLEQFLLRDNRRTSGQLLHNKGEKERLQTEDKGAHPESEGTH